MSKDVTENKSDKTLCSHGDNMLVGKGRHSKLKVKIYNVLDGNECFRGRSAVRSEQAAI